MRLFVIVLWKYCIVTSWCRRMSNYFYYECCFFSTVVLNWRQMKQCRPIQWQ